MSDVIDFIEKLGQDAHLRDATRVEVERVLRQMDIEPALSALILSEDSRPLADLLGAQANVCCMVYTPEEEREEESDDEDDDVGEEEGDDEEEQVKDPRTPTRRASAVA